MHTKARSPDPNCQKGSETTSLPRSGSRGLQAEAANPPTLNRRAGGRRVATTDRRVGQETRGASFQGREPSVRDSRYGLRGSREGEASIQALAVMDGTNVVPRRAIGDAAPSVPVTATTLKQRSNRRCQSPPLEGGRQVRTVVMGE